ncbi:DUF945 family protein [Amphritea sp. 2_MG-2023]|uniref:DUF945 family protein n=1 Tax=Amphritea TaxID=515417 RepID=UPI001C07C4F7|nr:MULTISPECIES: DUF945 family protein [Amphritea]MBU2963871.1 YdgA family protein [Amphritea atlantica]MDO6419216.1 DUF945 family protein [Amphritea sp. 2_MG-2023]
MKKTYIAVAIAAAAVVGYAGVKQVSYQDHVKAGVENLVEQLNDTTILGEQFDVTIKSQQGGLMSSSGVILLNDSNTRRPTEFQVEYTVNHGLTSLLTGPSYTAKITNPVMKGNDEKTITRLVLDGQPIVVEGNMKSDSIDGEMIIPNIDFAERSSAMTVKPITVEFSADNFNDEGRPENFEMTADMPEFMLKERHSVIGFSGGKLFVNNSFDGEEGEGQATIEIAEASIEGITIKSFGVDIASKVDDEFTTSLAVNLGSFEGEGQHLSDGELKYKISGLDGKAVVKILEVAQEGAKYGWSDREMKQAVEGVMNERADQLLAQNPQFELQSFQFKQNGAHIINASGVAKLDAEKLPEHYLQDGFKSRSGANPQALMNAAFVDFSANIGKEAKDLVGRFNPMAAAMLEKNGDKFTFKLEKGQMTMNGDKI